MDDPLEPDRPTVAVDFDEVRYGERVCELMGRFGLLDTEHSGMCSVLEGELKEASRYLACSEENLRRVNEMVTVTLAEVTALTMQDRHHQSWRRSVEARLAALIVELPQYTARIIENRAVYERAGKSYWDHRAAIVEAGTPEYGVFRFDEGCVDTGFTRREDADYVCAQEHNNGDYDVATVALVCPVHDRQRADACTHCPPTWKEPTTA